MQVSRRVTQAADSDQLQQLLRSYYPACPHLDLEHMEERIPDSHRAYLEERFGKEVSDGFWGLMDRQVWDTSFQSWIDTFDFAYKTGISFELDPLYNELGRFAVPLLVKDLTRRRRPFEMVDMGCGEGRVTIPLACAVPALQRIYAVDLCAGAFERMDKLIDELPCELRQIAQERIVQIRGDIHNADIEERVKEMAKGNLRVGLASSPCDMDDVAYCLPRYLSGQGTVYVTNQDTLSNPGLLSRRALMRQANGQARFLLGNMAYGSGHKPLLLGARRAGADCYNLVAKLMVPTKQEKE